MNQNDDTFLLRCWWEVLFCSTGHWSIVAVEITDGMVVFPLVDRNATTIPYNENILSNIISIIISISISIIYYYIYIISNIIF